MLLHLVKIYNRGRATGVNVDNADDDEEEICQDDNIIVNLRVESSNVN